MCVRTREAHNRSHRDLQTAGLPSGKRFFSVIYVATRERLRVQAIVNLQRTPKDARAAVVVRAKIDAAMRCVMEELSIPIPVRITNGISVLYQQAGFIFSSVPRVKGYLFLFVCDFFVGAFFK